MCKRPFEKRTDFILFREKNGQIKKLICLLLHLGRGAPHEVVYTDKHRRDGVSRRLLPDAAVVVRHHGGPEPAGQVEAAARVGGQRVHEKEQGDGRQRFRSRVAVLFGVEALSDLERVQKQQQPEALEGGDGRVRDLLLREGEPDVGGRDAGKPLQGLSSEKPAENLRADAEDRGDELERGVLPDFFGVGLAVERFVFPGVLEESAAERARHHRERDPRVEVRIGDDILEDKRGEADRERDLQRDGSGRGSRRMLGPDDGENEDVGGEDFLDHAAGAGVDGVHVGRLGFARIAAHGGRGLFAEHIHRVGISVPDAWWKTEGLLQTSGCMCGEEIIYALRLYLKAVLFHRSGAACR